VIGLKEAIAIAKAVLASQAQELADEDAKYEAWLEQEYSRRQDYLALVDDAIEHDYAWIRQGC
jgi:hypothetical protein